MGYVCEYKIHNSKSQTCVRYIYIYIGKGEAGIYKSKKNENSFFSLFFFWSLQDAVMRRRKRTVWNFNVQQILNRNHKRQRNCKLKSISVKSQLKFNCHDILVLWLLNCVIKTSQTFWEHSEDFLRLFCHWQEREKKSFAL